MKNGLFYQSALAGFVGLAWAFTPVRAGYLYMMPQFHRYDMAAEIIEAVK